MVIIVVNNVLLVKQQPQVIHLAISESGRFRATKLGEVIDTYNIVVLVKQQ